MAFAPDVPEHKGFGPATPGQMGFEPVSAGHKNCALSILGHTDFSPTAGLDPSLALARVDPIDMSIRVVAARVDLATIKAIPMTADVDLVKA